jgi:murein tripeptide amidase MpaA
VSVRVIGETVMGRPISAITFGDEGPSASRVWVIARQHPGETMSAWCAEGIVDRLLDPGDPVAAALLEEAVITVVPGVNLDGGALGNHRTNAAGRDLNRSWDAPDLERTPEVFAVRAAMLETGVDLFLDVHGDETVPFAFAAGSEGNPAYSERIEALERGFVERMAEADPGFSVEPGYERDAPGEADLSMASNWVGERFDCLSLTLELPFKDDERHPDRARGWSPGKSVRFGRGVVEAIFASLEGLR